jgi:ribulose-phosphate 3-epimerase
MRTSSLCLHLGVKADPIEYRYSYEWLFRLLREEGIHHVQIGTFFEIYQLPDDFFLDLKRKAQDYDIAISSIFTAHRELGGFFRTEPGFVTVARQHFERLIEVGSLLGATSVGSNPGAVLRDQMGLKEKGTRCYVEHMKELLHFAHDNGVPFLGIEPMSCLAEPPTLPHEIRGLAEELLAYHQEHPCDTSRIGYCVDVSHGYADRDHNVVFDNMELFQAALPFAHEIHLKNTDSIFNSTFGFTEEQRKKGIVDVPRVRKMLLEHADSLPVSEIVAYLEIGGPKTGRDYSDCLLETELRESLGYLKETFLDTDIQPHTGVVEVCRVPAARHVQVAPSLMCADLCHLEDEVRRLEGLGVDYLHMDIMDAHFVPNMPLGLETLRHLRSKTALPFDVHLMVDNNDFFIHEVAAIGAQFISVHAETCVHLDRTLSLIQSFGAKAGVALNPATPLNVLDYVIDKLDFVLLMTVNPGYSGQKLVDSTLDKIAQCRKLLNQHGAQVPIEVDGNVSFEHIPRMVAAGADILVAGTSSLFARSGSLQENHRKTLHAIQEGLAQ